MKTKRFVSTLLALLLICGLPLSAFAEEYDLSVGSVTVNATESGQTVTHGSNAAVPDSAPVITQSDSSTPTTNTVTITATENATANVTIQDVNIVISDPAGSPQNHSGQAAVTIDVADGASANVTLDGVNINTKNTGGEYYTVETHEPSNFRGEAAVQITGNGDVTLELDGENTLQGGYKRAGVEKNTTADSGNGELTITDENGTSGTLEATGGTGGSGIGGGADGSGSNITITGNAEVTATGGTSGSGIGGGAFGSGSNITIEGNANVTTNGGSLGSGIGGGCGRSGSDIIITESAKVTANGGNNGAGIGGGIKGSGSNITITGSATVDAIGGVSGSGIGGGYQSTGSSNITVSQDAQVKAQGGKANEMYGQYYGAGAAIGDGGGVNTDGAEVSPNTDQLTPKGKIEYYAPGADMSTTDPYKTVNGTCVPPQDEEKPDQPAEPAQTAPLYRVVNQDGKDLSCETERKDGVLTITVDADIASLTGKLGGIQTLKAQGIDTIVFVTNGATSTFALSDLLSQGSTGDSYTLTHDGSTVTFTLNNGSDVSAILQ